MTLINQHGSQCKKQLDCENFSLWWKHNKIGAKVLFSRKIMDDASNSKMGFLPFFFCFVVQDGRHAFVHFCFSSLID